MKLLSAICSLFTITMMLAAHTSRAEDAPAKQKPQINQPAPLFQATDTKGVVVNLADYKGKIVVLEWKNDQCPFVRKHYKTNNMQTLQQFAKNNDIVWVSVISSAVGKQGYVDAAEANRIASIEKSSASHIILDPQGILGQLYGAKTTPHMFVIDTTGKLAYMGAIDDTSTADPEDVAGANNYVNAAMKSLLSGNMPALQVSSPYGCSVKYAY